MFTAPNMFLSYFSPTLKSLLLFMDITPVYLATPKAFVLSDFL